MLRAPFDTGCFVVGSICAYCALSVAPSFMSWDFGVPGFARYIPIWLYGMPCVASSVWMRMYCAKQRARLPVLTGRFATLQVGIGVAAMLRPAPFASAVMAFGVMSGVPTICCCLSSLATVLLPLVPSTI